LAAAKKLQLRLPRLQWLGNLGGDTYLVVHQLGLQLLLLLLVLPRHLGM